MGSLAGHSHSATALVAVPSHAAFAFLADPLALGRWSLGCMQTRPSDAPGVFSGTSLYDGSKVEVALEVHRDLLLIDYLVGPPGDLKRRISARVIAAETCDLPPDQCYVTLLAWRTASMSAERWQRLCSAHEAEVWIIKSQLESSRQSANPPSGSSTPPESSKLREKE